MSDKYTQGNEEQFILEAIATAPSPGRFLDIGAWNAKVFSNTRALFDRGWGGVLIEPSPDPFTALLKEYGGEERITLVQAAVGLEPGLVKFYATADAVSTSDPAKYDQWKGAAKFDGAFFVAQITLAQVLGQFGSFDMVSIDAEGISVNLFVQLMKTDMKPRCVVVEHDQRFVETASAAQEGGYQRVFANENNEVWALK